MKFIIDFYQALDALNKIIFWGVIIVILLLIVFSILMINKKRNHKRQPDNKLYQDEIYSDEIALPSNSRDTLIMKNENLLIQEEKQTNFEPFVIPEKTDKSERIEVEKNFKVEDHVMEYNNELFNLSNVKKNSEIFPEKDNKNDISEKPVFKMPTKPYERNVLREMSLSQTSPIGIVKRDEQFQKITRRTVENQVSSSKNQFNVSHQKNVEQTRPESVNEELSPKKEELITNEVDTSVTQPKKDPSVTHIAEPLQELQHKNHIYEREATTITEKQLDSSINKIHNLAEQSLNKKIDLSISSYSDSTDKPLTPVQEKVPAIEITNQNSELKHKNANFLEEVSQKLASADIYDEIDRTDYELQQEEDAIISYKELMEKKDTIKTIDEEDAIISIKELTKRKEQEEKLYNLTENEENNEFIDELKKFRNDLN